LDKPPTYLRLHRRKPHSFWNLDLSALSRATGHTKAKMLKMSSVSGLFEIGNIGLIFQSSGCSLVLNEVPLAYDGDDESVNLSKFALLYALKNATTEKQ
jgi:hypothetical protein